MLAERRRKNQSLACSTIINVSWQLEHFAGGMMTISIVIGRIVCQVQSKAPGCRWALIRPRDILGLCELPRFLLTNLSEVFS